ncbi:esterase-like activity of phytase family protein, partial [Acinetobacter baumannii]
RWGFGGYSGLSLADADGRFVAISDLGHFLSGRMTFDAQGRVTGIAEADFEPMRDLEGRAITEKKRGDAEAVRHDTDGSLLVAFEREHRIWRYAAV